MANGDGQGKEFLPGDIIEGAGQKFEKTTTLREVVDWLRGKGKKPKVKEEKQEEQEA